MESTQDRAPTPPYPRPPIIEAVFAFHFLHPLDRRTIERLASSLKKKFPAQTRIMDVTIDTARATVPHSVQPNGYILRDADNSLTLIIEPEALSAARLPPYTTWEDLIDHAKSMWAKLKKVAGHPQLIRLSTRFINRIDIRSSQAAEQKSEKNSINLATYLQFGLTIPPAFASLPLFSFSLSCHLGNTRDTLRHTIQVASVPSPLIDHTSLILDIDVATTEAVPMLESEMWAIAQSLRVRKNEIFEASITDATRRLFA